MEFTGKTVEEAIALGLVDLGLTKEQAKITVKEEPTKGLFGKVKGKAVVEIEKQASKEENAVKFVEGIFKLLNINAKANLKVDEDETTIDIIAESSSEIIGRRGEVLDAIQVLTGAVANIGNKDYKKVVVNCENYRERREDTLVALAHKLEAKATDMKRDVILEPMSPFERRIIHTALAESTTVTTKSEGKEPNRYVIIVPNEKDEFAKPYNAGRNRDQKGFNGKRDKKDFGRKKNGFSTDRRQRKSNGFSEMKSKKPSLFGTYLGNSLKDNK